MAPFKKRWNDGGMDAYKFHRIRRLLEFRYFRIERTIFRNENFEDVTNNEWQNMTEEEKAYAYKLEDEYKALVASSKGKLVPDFPVIPFDYGCQIPNGWTSKLEPKPEEFSFEIVESFYTFTGIEEFTPLPYNKNFIVVHFGTYCPTERGLLPAEFCIGVFNIRDGLKECYSRILDPGCVTGELADILNKIKKTKYERPGFDPSCDFGKDCLDHLEYLMEKYQSLKTGPGFLYTLHDENPGEKHMSDIWNILEHMTLVTGRQIRFKLIPFSFLVLLLIKEAEKQRTYQNLELLKVPNKESDILRCLSDNCLNHYHELACNFHQQEAIKWDYVLYCSMNIVKRWIYHALALLTEAYQVYPYPYNHLPKPIHPKDRLNKLFFSCASRSPSAKRDILFVEDVKVILLKEIEDDCFGFKKLPNEILITNEIYPDLKSLEKTKSRPKRVMKFENIPSQSSNNNKDKIPLQWNILGEKRENKIMDVSLAHGRTWKQLTNALKDKEEIDYKIEELSESGPRVLSAKQQLMICLMDLKK